MVSFHKLLELLLLMGLQQIVMLHKLEVLQVVGVGLANALTAVVHKSEEDVSLKTGHHQHFQVFSLNIFDFFIVTENRLLLDPCY